MTEDHGIRLPPETVAFVTSLNANSPSVSRNSGNLPSAFQSLGFTLFPKTQPRPYEKDLHKNAENSRRQG